MNQVLLIQRQFIMPEEISFCFITHLGFHTLSNHCNSFLNFRLDPTEISISDENDAGSLFKAVILRGKVQGHRRRKICKPN